MATAYVILKDYSTGDLKFSDQQIHLGVEGHYFTEENRNYVFFAIPNELKRDYEFVIPLTLTLSNSFNVDDSDVLLSIQYDKASRRPFFTEDMMSNRSHRMNSDFKFEIQSLKDYDYAKHQLTSLESMEKFSFNEAAFAQKISFGKGVPVLFQNGISVDLKASTDSKRDKTRDWDISYRGVNIDNPTQMKQWMHDFYAKSIAIELRKEENAVSYIYKILFGKKIRVFAFYPEFSDLPEQNIYFPKKSPDNYDLFIIKPYSWDLL